VDKAECLARHIPWPLGECISGSGDFVPHPGEERFDFPCSQTFRDYYNETPVEAEHETVEVPEVVPDKRYHSLRAQYMKLQKQLDGMKVEHRGVDV